MIDQLGGEPEGLRQPPGTTTFSNDGVIEGVSIVIPTCRVSSFTSLCLDLVCASAERWRGRKEVILGVDRALKPNDPLLLLSERYPFVRLVQNQALSGAPRVRKLALRQARYSVLVFTDDDCLVERDWVERMVRGALEHGVFTGGVASAEPALVFSEPGSRPRSRSFETLWRMEEIIDRYRLLAVDSAGNSKYVSFPNLSLRRELLPPVAFDSVFEQSADDMDLGYRLRLNGFSIRTDRIDHPVRTAYPASLREALRRKARHAKGIAYVHRRFGRGRLRPLEPGSLARIWFRWAVISFRAPLALRDRFIFLLLNLTYCACLTWHLTMLRGIREFPDWEIHVAPNAAQSEEVLPEGLRAETVPSNMGETGAS